MSQCVDLLTTLLTALTELLAVTNEQFNQLSEDHDRQQIRTGRDVTIALNRLPALLPFSRQGTPKPLKQNPRFQ